MKSARLGEVWKRVATMAPPGTSPLDVVADWASMLSLGEQQRVAFARILLTRPSLVLMDESTSALDTTNEAALYRALHDAGVTFISVGHRPTLLDFHSKVLYMTRTGSNGASRPTWELHPAAEFKANFASVAT